MKQSTRVKILLVSLGFVGSGNMYGVTQLQETSIHPVWYFTNSGVQLKRAEKTTKYRTITDQLGGTENSKIPQKTNNLVRVATYNVHFWRNPYGGWDKKVVSMRFSCIWGCL